MAERIPFPHLGRPSRNTRFLARSLLVPTCNLFPLLTPRSRVSVRRAIHRLPGGMRLSQSQDSFELASGLVVQTGLLQGVPGRSPEKLSVHLDKRFHKLGRSFRNGHDDSSVRSV